MLTGLLIVIGLFFLSLLFMWLPDQTVEYWTNLPDALVTTGTLALALAAVWTIKNSNEQEKRRARQALLKKIVDWAIDVSKVHPPLSSAILFDLEKELEHDMNTAAKQAEVYGILRKGGLYLSKLAPKLDKQLGRNVDDVIKNIRTRELLCYRSVGVPSSGSEIMDIDERAKYMDDQSVKRTEYIKTKDPEIWNSLDRATQIGVELYNNANKLNETVETLFETTINLMLK